MHELGVAQQIVKGALAYAEQHQAARITQLEIEMSSAVDESENALRYHLENVARNTLAAGAQIEIRRVPVRQKCFECGHESERDAQARRCPKCGSARVVPLPHEGFRLASIEITTMDDSALAQAV